MHTLSRRHFWDPRGPAAKWSVEWYGTRKARAGRMRGDTGMERSAVRKKRTVISWVIAPPDMTGTREHSHRHWLRRDKPHGVSGRETKTEGRNMTK